MTKEDKAINFHYLNYYIWFECFCQAIRLNNSHISYSNIQLFRHDFDLI